MGEQVVRDRNPVLTHQHLITHQDSSTVHYSVDAAARRIRESFRLPDSAPHRSSVGHDSLTQRVLGSNLRGGGGVQNHEFINTGGRYEGTNFRPPIGQRSGFIKDNSINPTQLLEEQATFNDSAGARSTADSA